MDSDIQSFAFVAMIIVGLVGSLSFIGVLSYKVATSASRKPKAVARPDDERLERLQQSVDAIAIEVERIAEAQRFSAKLLVERGDKASLKA
ncbi:MAG: hypothetical protein JWM95_5087 [Gemmatimonadetes bacterium]|nr:hypothetical protein [Gemmatimonadota bacterium]